MEEYRNLPFDQLRTLYQDIGALLAERRSEAIQNLRQQAETLGVELKEIVQKKKRGRPKKVDNDNI